LRGYLVTNLHLTSGQWYVSPVPRSDDISITVKKPLANGWREVAIELGYGPHGRQKFLAVCLEIAAAHPSLFRKR